MLSVEFWLALGEGAKTAVGFFWKSAWHPMIGYGGLFMWLILIIVAGALVYYLFMRSKNGGGFKTPSKERPAEILKRRYAAGEITKEEFETRKKDIES